MSGRQRFVLNSPLVVADTVDGEAIVVHLGTGTYYSFLGDSMLLWNAVAAGAGSERIAAEVAAASGTTADAAQKAVDEFCSSLLAEGLIVEPAGEADPEPDVDLSAGGEGLVAPSFESHTDMQDLVLLDPVHEVDERGWPHAQSTV